MSPSYIYPEWYRAQARLIEDIKEAIATNKKIADVIYDWFGQHIFEVGISHHQSIYELDQIRANIAEMDALIESTSLAKIGGEIARAGLFTRIVSEGTRERVTTFTVLTFGAPIMTGPGTREAKDMTKQENSK